QLLELLDHRRHRVILRTLLLPVPLVLRFGGEHELRHEVGEPIVVVLTLGRHREVHGGHDKSPGVSRTHAPDERRQSSTTVTRPVAPSTSIMAPAGSRLAAPLAFTTHGTPNSRATIAACDIGPPSSVTTAAAYANA